MSQRNRQTPWKCLRESEAHMSPGTHVTHDGHPTEALTEKRAWRIVIRDGLDGVRKQLDFKALLRNQPANEKIIGGTILDGFVAAESGEMGTSRDDCLSESEFDSIQLAGHQDPRIEVVYHTDRLKMLRECFVLSGNIQAGHAAHFCVAERGYHGSQIIRLDANVAVVDDKDFIASFVYHAHQFGYFI